MLALGCSKGLYVRVLCVFVPVTFAHLQCHVLCLQEEAPVERTVRAPAALSAERRTARCRPAGAHWMRVGGDVTDAAGVAARSGQHCGSAV